MHQMFWHRWKILLAKIGLSKQLQNMLLSLLSISIDRNISIKKGGIVRSLQRFNMDVIFTFEKILATVMKLIHVYANNVVNVC